MTGRQDSAREVVRRLHDVMPLRRSQRAGETARALERSEARFRCLVEATSDLVWLADPGGALVHISRGWQELTGQAADKAQGMSWVDALAPDDRDRVSRLWADAVRARARFEAEYRIRTAEGGCRQVAVRSAPILDAEGNVLEWIGLVTDVTESRAAEEELRTRARQQEALADLGRAALTGAPTSRLLDRAAGVIADTLSAKCVEVLELDPSGRELTVRAGLGWGSGVVGSARVRSDRRSLQGFALHSDVPVVVEAAASERRFELPLYLRDHGVDSSMAMVIRGNGGPYGVLAAHATGRAAFSPADVSFLRTVANVLAAAIQRQRAADATREARDELEALIEASPVPIVAYDRQGVVTLWNPAAEDVFGWTASEAIGKLLPIVPEDKLEEFHEIRRRVLAGQPFSGFEARRQRKGGSPIDVSFWNAALRDAGGAVRGVVAVVSDITERKRREQTLEFIAEVGETLSSTLDYERTLAQVARLLVPRLADCCVVDILDEDEHEPHQLAIVHVDPAMEQLVTELERRHPSDPHAPKSFVGAVLRERRPRLEPRFTDALLREMARDDDHLAALRSLGLVSGLCVPLVARGRVLGAITLLSSSRRYEREDLALAIDLSRHAAIAVDNARLYRQRSRIATTLQRSLLPRALPDIPGVELAARYRAAGAGYEVGGDFYDAFETGEGTWALVIGDVCGKGPEAAAVTGLTRHAIRASAVRDRSPTRTLERLNEALLREYDGSTFCTVAYGRMELRGEGLGARLTFACGGHPLPIRLRSSSEIGTLGCHGNLVGIFPDPDFGDEVVEVHPGDVLIFYTDGLVEGSSGGVAEGEQRLLELLRGVAGLSAAEVADRIEGSIETGRTGGRDDVAILVIRLLP